MPKEKTYYIFKTNPKETTCAKCFKNDNRLQLLLKFLEM